MDYIIECKVFGKFIGMFQNSCFKMVEMCIELDMGWVFIDYCMKLYLQGKLSVEVVVEVKFKILEIEVCVVDDCL